MHKQQHNMVTCQYCATHSELQYSQLSIILGNGGGGGGDHG
jgi:hypothetical protein